MQAGGMVPEPQRDNRDMIRTSETFPAPEAGQEQKGVYIIPPLSRSFPILTFVTSSTILHAGISTRSFQWSQIEMLMSELMHLNDHHEPRQFLFSETRLIEKVSGERVRLDTGTGQRMNASSWPNTR